MRTIKYIVIHCTGTTVDAEIESIKNYWKDVRKWTNPGYHYIIEKCGCTTQFVEDTSEARCTNVVTLLSDKHIANGVVGKNKESIHIAYIGGKDKKGVSTDTRTSDQEEAMFNLVIELLEKYPKAKVVGHRDFKGVTKTCPNFDVGDWLAYFEPDFSRPPLRK